MAEHASSGLIKQQVTCEIYSAALLRMTLHHYSMCAGGVLAIAYSEATKLTRLSMMQFVERLRG